MPRVTQPGPIAFLPIAVRRARWLLLLATLVTACAQTSPITSLNGTWDFAFAADAPAADRLARFYEDGFQGGGFQPAPAPSVVGRSEKNRRPEAPEYRLDTGSSAVFPGA